MHGGTTPCTAGDRNAELSNANISFADHCVTGDPPCSSPRRRATSTQILESTNNHKPYFIKRRHYTMHGGIGPWSCSSGSLYPARGGGIADRMYVLGSSVRNGVRHCCHPIIDVPSHPHDTGAVGSTVGRRGQRYRPPGDQQVISAAAGAAAGGHCTLREAAADDVALAPTYTQKTRPTRTPTR
jgi:hypothetical protein